MFALPRMFHLFFLLLCLSSSYFGGVQVASAAIETKDSDVDVSSKETNAVKDKVFAIEHHLGRSSYSHRTTVKIVTKPDGKQVVVFPEKNAISEPEYIDSFRKLVGESGFYKIKIKSLGNNSTPPILASIPACELQKSGFKEDISIYMDADKNLIGVSYMSPPTAVSRQCAPSKINEMIKFQTRIKFGDTLIGQSIPVQALGQRPASIPKDIKLGPDAEDESQNKPSQQTFLRKYWYVVVMMVLYLLLGGSEPEKGTKTARKPAAK